MLLYEGDEYLINMPFEVYDDNNKCNEFLNDLKTIISKDDVFDKGIKILHCSCGGDFNNALLIYFFLSYLCEKGIKIEFIGYQDVSSSAAIVMQACSIRSVMDQTAIMFHYPMVKFEAHVDNDHMYKVAKLGNHFNDMLLKAVYKKTRGKISKSKLRNMFINSKIITPQEALSYGLIDKIYYM